MPRKQPNVNGIVATMQSTKETIFVSKKWDVEKTQAASVEATITRSGLKTIPEKTQKDCLLSQK